MMRQREIERERERERGSMQSVKQRHDMRLSRTYRIRCSDTINVDWNERAIR